MKSLKIFSFLFINFINFNLFSIDYKELTIEAFANVLPDIEQKEIYIHLQKTSENHGYVTVIGIINEQPEKVWKVMHDPNKKIYSDILENHVVYHKDTYYIKKKLIDLPFPLKDRWTVIEEFIYDAIFAKQWKEIGGDIRINRGAIRLFPYKGKTLMLFKASFDPGLSFVPEWAIQYGMKIKGPSIITKIKENL